MFKVLILCAMMATATSCISTTKATTAVQKECVVEDSIVRIRLISEMKIFYQGKLVEVITSTSTTTGSYIGNKKVLTVEHGLFNLKFRLVVGAAAAFRRVKSKYGPKINKKDVKWYIKDNFYILTTKGEKQTIKVFKRSSEDDLIVFKLKSEIKNCPIQLAKQPLKKYSVVTGVGYPHGITHGGMPHAYIGVYMGEDVLKIVRKKYTVGGYTFKTYPGISGGPILYKKKIVAIIMARDYRFKTVSYGIPLRKIKKFLNSSKKK